MTGIADPMQKSFGTREEHRITLTLFHQLIDEGRSMDGDKEQVGRLRPRTNSRFTVNQQNVATTKSWKLPYLVQ
jgi:hypothetical protein